MNVHGAQGVAVREFPLVKGYGTADYVLYVDGQVVGVIEAKKEGTPLAGVELQAERYAHGLGDSVPAPLRPLAFRYLSTGIETRFANYLDPEPRSRSLFHFHRPAVLQEWLAADPLPARGDLYPVGEDASRPSTFRGRVRTMPPLVTTGLWPAQIQAIRNLEASFGQDRPRALIQMATGSGKTFTAISSVYRLIKHAGARRVLFLVDRANLGRQAHKEFQQYTTPDDGRKFTELYNVQLLASNKIDPVAKVVITTIQRLYSMLKGDADLDPTLEEGSQYDTGGSLVREPVPVAYNAALPIELFDVLFVDECHRSIYSLWRQVLEYFDASVVGLTATPSKQTFGFFNQNLVMEYGHPQAVADGVNVDYDVYRIRTRITEQGSTIEAGSVEAVGKRDRETRAVRWEKLDEDVTYAGTDLDRDVVALDQIRTVVRTFRDRLFTEIFPGRREVPKTLIFAKDDSHADDVVKILREEFGKGNDFAEKITYRTGTARVVTKVMGPGGKETERVDYKATGVKPEDLLSSFRNSYNPRVVVTVDMIATGTDIKPLEIVWFLRAVKSRNFFEQMKGRGVRVISPTELQAVTTDATSKDRFVLVDCVGICESDLIDSPPLEKKKSISLEKLLQLVAMGNTEPDVLSSLASRLARIDRKIGEPDREALAKVAGGVPLAGIVSEVVEALEPDRQVQEARRRENLPPGTEPTEVQVKKAAEALLTEAAKPIASNPTLRNALLLVQKALDQVLDEVSKDEILEAGYSEAAREKAHNLVTSFETFLKENKDEITALQVLYSRPYRQRLKYEDVKALVDALKAPPRSWTPDLLWRAYETLEKSRVKGAASRRLLTDVVSLVRFALHDEGELVPFSEKVAARFEKWIADHEMRGEAFTAEQRQWLEDIRDHIAANLRIEADDFEYVPFGQKGGLGRAHQLFGARLVTLLDELNEALAA